MPSERSLLWCRFGNRVAIISHSVQMHLRGFTEKLLHLSFRISSGDTPR